MDYGSNVAAAKQKSQLAIAGRWPQQVIRICNVFSDALRLLDSILQSRFLDGYLQRAVAETFYGISQSQRRMQLCEFSHSSLGRNGIAIMTGVSAGTGYIIAISGAFVGP